MGTQTVIKCLIYTGEFIIGTQSEIKDTIVIDGGSDE